MKYAGTPARPTQMMMWPLFAEYLIGIAWAYSMTFILLLALINVVYPLPQDWHVSVVPHWHACCCSPPASCNRSSAA